MKKWANWVLGIAIVLLILGLTLTTNIFSQRFSQNDNAIKLTDDQLKNILIENFNSLEDKLAIYPSSGLILKAKEEAGIGFAVKNLLNDPEYFVYEIVFKKSDCAINSNKAEDLIYMKSKGEIKILSGEIGVKRIWFKIPKEMYPCTIWYDLVVYNKENKEVYEKAPLILRIIK